MANIETSRIVPCIETLFSNIVSSRETRDSREIAKISREIVEKFRDASSASSEADLTGIERCGGGRWRVNREGAPFGRERRGPVCRSDAAVMSTNIYLIGSAAARRRTLPLCYAGAISIPSSPSASERGTTVPSLSPPPNIIFERVSAFVGKAIGYNRPVSSLSVSFPGPGLF